MTRASDPSTKFAVRVVRNSQKCFHGVANFCGELVFAGSSQPQLREIKRKDDGVDLLWSDGLQQSVAADTLRRNCPCAGCREARGDTSHAQPLTAKPSMLKIVDASSAEQTRLTQIWAVGNYAVGMEWQDGHNSGIYTYEYLRSLV